MSLASAAELSFSWMGFLTAMLSNLTFGFRAVLSKQYAPHPTNLTLCGVQAVSLSVQGVQIGYGSTTE